MEIGQEIEGFILENIAPIPEINCCLFELKHKKTGAEVQYIEADDDENVFCIALKTVPTTSNGVAHIVEHCVLCGSKRFPVKDPFFSMTRRSLNTFMNAMTGSDFTCYPAASQVKQDFYNLLDVYLDAVFHPLMEKEAFLQEGIRLEFNENKQLQFQGIVYNEMKGAMGRPLTRLQEALNEALYPNITYGVNSGGEPKVIPSLSYEEFCEFQRQAYHPSRAIFYFYGNLPLKGHLKFLNEKLLNTATALDPLPPIPKQKRFISPVKKRGSYPIGADENLDKRTLCAIGWLTCHVLEQKELLALHLIDSILMDTDASPLKMALLKSGLCQQASSYLESDISEAPFVITLQGCDPDAGEKLEKFILNALQEIVEKGISKKELETALHQLELDRSEISGDGYPYGLSLFFRSGLLKQHQGKPEYGLMIHSLFKELNEQLDRNPRYLEDLIEKYLIQNTHRVLVTLEPNTAQGKMELDEERATLEALSKTLSAAKIKEIEAEKEALKKYQDDKEEEDCSILPTIKIEDIQKNEKEYSLQEFSIANLTVFYHEAFTNGLLYADLVTSIPSLNDRETSLIRLFAMLGSQLGYGGRNYKETLDYVQAHTGGVDLTLGIHGQSSNPADFKPTLHIKGKSLSKKGDHLFKLIREMREGIDWSDSERIEEILLKHMTSLESKLQQNSMKYALGEACEGISGSARLSNKWFGLPHYKLVKEIVEKKLSLIDEMKALEKKLFGVGGRHLVITCSKEDFETLRKEEFYGLTKLEAKPFSSWICEPGSGINGAIGRVISSQVAFSAMAVPTLPYDHPDTAALTLASHIFDNDTLHPLIREQGGAYGSGAVNNSSNGCFSFYAYRDPQIASSFSAFDASVKKVAEGNFEEEDIEEAILEVIQSLDSPVAPGYRGEYAYALLLEGKTPEKRQAFRDKILGATKKEIVDAVKKHLVPKIQSGCTISFAGKDLLEKENKRMSKPLEVLPI